MHGYLQSRDLDRRPGLCSSFSGRGAEEASLEGRWQKPKIPRRQGIILSRRGPQFVRYAVSPDGHRFLERAFRNADHAIAQYSDFYVSPTTSDCEMRSNEELRKWQARWKFCV